MPTDTDHVIHNHDLHIHTTLSHCCTDPGCTPTAIIAKAASLAIGTIGFTNHFWDETIPGASEWYRKQDRTHLFSIRQEIPEDTLGVRVLVGCETEFCGGQKVGISTRMAQALDFVLIPASHFHMTGFVVEAWQVANPHAIADLLVERFQEVLELGLASGIPHPFLPLGFFDQFDQISEHLSTGALQDCFGRAAELGVSIEIQPGMLPGSQGTELDGFHDESMLRILREAVQSQCLFHLGSDTHSLEHFGSTRRLASYLQLLQIPDEQFRIW